MTPGLKSLVTYLRRWDGHDGLPAMGHEDAVMLLDGIDALEEAAHFRGQRIEFLAAQLRERDRRIAKARRAVRGAWCICCENALKALAAPRKGKR